MWDVYKGVVCLADINIMIKPFDHLIIRIFHFPTGKQEHKAQAIFNHTEDYVMFPDEATTSLCAWNSRNASRKQLLSLGHNGPVRLIVHSPTAPAFLTCSDDFRARFWFRRMPTH